MLLNWKKYIYLRFGGKKGCKILYETKPHCLDCHDSFRTKNFLTLNIINLNVELSKKYFFQMPDYCVLLNFVQHDNFDLKGY